jgi:hypothetical protein
LAQLQRSVAVLQQVLTLAQWLAENGRRGAEEMYDGRVVYQRLDDVYAFLAK